MGKRPYIEELGREGPRVLLQVCCHPYLCEGLEDDIALRRAEAGETERAMLVVRPGSAAAAATDARVDALLLLLLLLLLLIDFENVNLSKCPMTSVVDAWIGKVDFRSVCHACPLFSSLQATSGKMVLLDKLLPKLRAEGHKVCLNTLSFRPRPNLKVYRHPHVAF